MYRLKVLVNAVFFIICFIGSPAMAGIRVQTTHIRDFVGVNHSTQVDDAIHIGHLSGSLFEFQDDHTFIFYLPSADQDLYPVYGRWEYLQSAQGSEINLSFWGQSTAGNETDAVGLVVSGTLDNNQLYIEVYAEVNLAQCSRGDCAPLKPTPKYQATLDIEIEGTIDEEKNQSRLSY